MGPPHQQCTVCRKFVNPRYLTAHEAICRSRQQKETAEANLTDQSNDSYTPESQLDDPPSEGNVEEVSEGLLHGHEEAIRQWQESQDKELPLPPMPRNAVRDGAKWLFNVIFILLLAKTLNFTSNGRFERDLAMYKHICSLSPGMAVFAAMVPTSLYMVFKYLGISSETHVARYIPCSTCNTLYTEDQIVYYKNGCLTDRNCTSEVYKCGKLVGKCNNKLVTREVQKDGRVSFKPKYVYCVNSIAKVLESQLKRPDLENQCAKWRSRNTIPNTYCDIYDGKVWQNLEKYQGPRNRDFLSLPNTYGFMINIDWFLPYDNRKNSIGIIYLANMNLPRDIRHKRENVIVLSIIPDFPHEPSNINPYLAPIVDQLQELWYPGIVLSTFNHPEGVRVKAALVCSSADVPAARKLSGFLGHTAIYGCTKCKWEFKGGVGNKDYSGFQMNLWPRRTYAAHKQAVEKINAAKNKTQKSALESQYGYRYSELMRLEYHNSIANTAIDPMHCLYEGIAKKMWTIWTDEKTGALKPHIKTIDERISEVDTARQLGRVPLKMSLRTRITADEWKNWTLNYSLIVLQGLLPNEKLKHWQTFVKACRLITRPLISKRELKLAELLFVKFGQEFERIYGRDKVVPNMHFACHLSEVVEELGPVYCFWLFAFERYNGFMGKYNSNGREIETTIMRNIVIEDQLTLMEHTDNRLGESKEVIASLRDRKSLATACNSMYYSSTLPIQQCMEYWTNFTGISVQGKALLSSLDDDEFTCLRSLYSVLYDSSIPLQMSKICENIGAVTISGETFGSKLCHRLRNYSRIMASWYDTNAGVCSHVLSCRPGTVTKFVRHSIMIDGDRKCHILAVVRWNVPYPVDFGYLDPVRVYYRYKFEPMTLASFIPIQRLRCQYIARQAKDGGENISIVIPVERKLFC